MSNLYSYIKRYSGTPGPPGPAGGASITTSDTAPTSPADGDLWWNSSDSTGGGQMYVWYEDGTSGQWVPASPSTGDGGGGGGGIPEAPVDSTTYGRNNGAWVAAAGSLEGTPVGPVGSTVEQTLPQWLAGAPIVTTATDIFDLSSNHVGIWLHVTNDVLVEIYLPDTWLAGWSCGVRQVGEGIVSWYLTGSSTLQMPATRATHNHILEQYEEVVFRVVANSDGHHAVWTVSGATA